MNLYYSPVTLSLGRAFALSLVLHAAVLIWGARLLSALPSIDRQPDPALKVRLVEPPAVASPAPQPELLIRQDTPREAISPPLQKSPPRLARAPDPLRPAPAGAQALAGEAARKAGEQIAKELFYPPEAIERGLEGEALVLLFLDESGNAIAARIEASSGHAILDAAAVRAARTLKSLPANAPREALLPVRFRLR
jgi:protein TonB